MPYKDLHSFLNLLEQEGELCRITMPVKTNLEMTEIQSRVLRDQGPCILFEKPLKDDGTISDIPVLVNLFGTINRIALGLNTKPQDLKQIGKLLAFLRQPDPPNNLKQAIKMLPIARNLLAMRPKNINHAPIHEIIETSDQVDLNKLPIQTCWPGEPAPLITWPLVITQGPNPKSDKSDQFNIGIYRMQILGKNRTAMRWLKHRGGAQHYQRWKQKGAAKKLPAAVVIGCDPGIILAGVTPIPDTLSEYQFAGLLRSKSVELTPCKTIPLKVPAYSEIVLEGHVLLDEMVDEGPYGDHTGYYNSVEQFPVFEVEAITRRKNAIYLSTFTGRPPDEPSVLGAALNDVFTPLLQQQFPEIVDFWLPPEACSYRMAVVSIKKAWPGHAKRIMMGVWSFLRQFLYTKWVIVVDEHINVRNWHDVIWAISTCIDPARDSMVIEHTPIDYLDFASPVEGLGSKIGLDATAKWPGETNREWGQILKMSPDVIKHIDDIWDQLGISKSKH
ncbi:MAG: UbiD family decarboxylase [Pseudomonadota bacterium]